ncbi:MAG: sigma-70 family RNA polymerase sigma factor [Oscillospiraceae bacterium]|nr:sigma-70 family RNA polymerase sigma factor [Oscillospiraceae bacterium]
MSICQSQARGDWVDEIVDRYADMVYRIAFTQTKNQADADDIFQEVFLKLCKSAVSFETDEHIKAWLIRVTINASRKFFGSGWNKKTVAFPEDLVYEEKDQYTEIIPIVQSLPSKYRTVIHLFYFEDMPIAEIAKILNLKATTIKSQLSRGRGIIKNKLKGGFENV